MKWFEELSREFYNRVELQAYPLRNVVLMRKREVWGWSDWMIVSDLIGWNQASFAECRNAVLRFEGKYEDIQERKVLEMASEKDSFEMGAAKANLWGKFLRADNCTVMDVMDIGYQIGEWSRKDATVDLNAFQKGFAERFFQINGITVTRRSLPQPHGDPPVDLG